MDHSKTPLSQRASAPAKTLTAVAVLCDPYLPLDPDKDSALIEDLQAIRGGDRLGRVVRNIRRSGSTPTLHLLTGHVGAGKTTELLAVRKRLGETSHDGLPLEVVFVDADSLLDRSDVDLEDILVAIWSAVYEQSPAAAQKVLTEVWAGQLKSGLTNALVNLPITASLDGILTRLRLSSAEQRKTIRTVLSSFSAVLIEGLNKAFDVLRKGPDNDIRNVAILVDNLEKLNPVDRTLVERLYVQRLWALRELDAHVVITVPIYLAYSSAGASLIGLYGSGVVMLPMIKVRTPDGAPYEAGIAALNDILAKRVDFPLLFAEGDEAARRISIASGGCIRHALRLAAGAADECEEPPVTAEAVNRSIAILRADFDRALPEAWVPVLKEIDQLHGFPANIDENMKREMLRHLFVLEYQNGDPAPWHAVHPLVLASPKFGPVKT